MSFKRHGEIDGCCHHRNNHAGTAHNGNCLQPPGNGTEYKMMRADNGIKNNLCPKSKYAKAVGINGFIYLLRNKIIQQANCVKCKPHAHT